MQNVGVFDSAFQNRDDGFFPLETFGSPQLPAFMFLFPPPPQEVQALYGPFPSCRKMIDGWTSFNPSNAERLKLW